LDRNTNLLSINPALKKLADIIQNEGLNDYPSPFNDELREKIAVTYSKYGITSDEIIIGNGSDAILDIFFKTFANPGDYVAAPYPTFHMLKFHVLVNMAQLIDIPLIEKDNKWELEPDGFLSSHAKLAVIATPNNPTPNAFDSEIVEEIVRNFKGIVLVDEAYYEYCGLTMLDKIHEYPNLVITRTFSKAYGLAGARVGYAIANKKLISQILRARIPYSVGKISEKLAILALDEKEFLNEVLAKNKECRKHLSDGLGRLGFKVYHSDANFILARLPNKHSSTQLAKKLAENGIFIVDYRNHPILSNCIRISVGTKEINNEVIELAKSYLAL